MPELLLLRFEILSRRRRRSNLERHTGHDLQAEAFDRDVLRRVVRQQLDLADAEVAEDLGTGTVVADVGSEAELRIRLDRVVPAVLKLVGLEFVDQADAPALLQQIE